MSLIILLIFFSSLFDNIKSQNDWVIQDATSVISLPNEKNLDLNIISANNNKIMLTRNSANGEKKQYSFDFENKFEDLNINAKVGGIYSEKIIIFYEKYLQVITEENLISKKFEIEPGFFRTTLKNVSFSYFYISTDYKLVKINVEEKTKSNFVVNQESKKIFDGTPEIYSISCDNSKNGEFYICSYFIDGKIEIYLFSREMALLNKRTFQTTVDKPKDYFNKIFFLKDNYKLISINAENNLIIRLRYLEIKNNNINTIKLNEEKNKAVEFIDLRQTLLDSSYLYNDLVALGNDEIFKVYMKDKKFILSKIQFYSNNILTVKTKEYDNMYNTASNVHLNKRNNGIIFDFINQNSFQFLQIGHIQPSVTYITSNDNFKLNNYEVQSLLKTKQFAEIESIPDNFTLIRSQENALLSRDSIIYPENEIFQLISYKKTTEEKYLYLQTKLIYEFPTDAKSQIFPSDETNYPQETKIISLGNKGIISFKIISCSNTFYNIENTDVCSKVRPEGYYFDHDKNMFLKCHNNCAECIIFSKDDSNMQCLTCKSGYIYNEFTFNCIPIQNYSPKTISIELINNGYFWVFLVIGIMALFIAILVLWQDIFFKKCLKSDFEKNNRTIRIMELDNTINDNESSNSSNNPNIINS